MRRAVIALAALAIARLAGAHALEPSLLELQEHAGGRVDVRWTTPALRLPGVIVRPRLPEGCRDRSDLAVDESGDRLVARWTVDCGPAGLVGRSVAVDGLAAARTDALVRIVLVDARTVQGVVSPDSPSLEVPARPAPGAVARAYIRLGVHHILTGWDHLLFVLGLLLLVGGGRRLLGTITAFTLGHSVTLSLAVLGVVHVSPRPVEVAIAGSVYLLAIELGRGAAAERRSLLARRPWLMAAGFGLLHGLGFAGALAEIGLPAADIPLALATFNVGIELGQLGVVLAALVAGRLLAAVPRPRWADAVPAYVIGSLAVLWMLERAVALVG
jgi:hypothetical protein